MLEYHSAWTQVIISDANHSKVFNMPKGSQGVLLLQRKLKLLDLANKGEK